jgi:hypothetical protein
MAMMCKGWNFFYAKEIKPSTILSMIGKSSAAQQ